MKKVTRMLGSLLGLAGLALPMAGQTTDAVRLSFNRTGTTAADVTVNVTDAAGTAIDGASATLAVSHDLKATGSLVTEAILCPDVNATANEDIVFTVTVSGLPDDFRFNAVEATTWALNASGDGQDAGQVRQWNLSMKQGADEASLADFATLTDYDLNNARPSLPVFEGTTTTTEGTLCLRLTASKGTENPGCFIGLEGLRLYTDNGEEETPAGGVTDNGDGTFTYSVAPAFGTMTSNTGSKYANLWTSTAEPRLTLTANASNMLTGANGSLELYQGSQGAHTYTLAVPEGWIIKSYSFDFTNSDASDNMTVAPADHDAVTCKADETATVSVDGIDAQTAVFDVTSASGSVKAAVTTGISVVIAPAPASGDAATFNVNMQTGNLALTGSQYSNNWSSTQTEPQLTLTAGANNMKANADGTRLELYQGTRGNTYTLAVPRGWLIQSYSFDFTNSDSNENMTITPAGGTAVTCEAAGTATVSVDGINAQTASFDVASANGGVKAAVTNNFVVTVTADPNAGETPVSVEVFSSEIGGNIPYRIPAITRMKDGSLLVISDYRYCRADIGNGHIDIVGRISTDNGQTWGEEFTIADGNGISGDHACGYGDGALVTDSATGHVLLMCCTGNKTYWGGNRQDPLRTARLYSEDGGRTWSTPEDVTEQIYGLFDDDAPINGLFFGSGRIAQSHLVKVGDYYRIYAALCTTNNGNRVIYSDDFGQTWKVLGGLSARPAPSGDEPKCEELPDGRVLLSSRKNGGRYFNIFTFSNVETGEGSWGGVVSSENQEGGVTVSNNTTNGEILIIPAVRNADGKQLYLALQSIPFGSGRANVGIWYKGLEDFNDYSTPANFASNWDGSYQVSNVASCYSTMMLQADGKLAFVYEETTPTSVSGGYTTVYMPLPIETITGGAYSLDLDVDRWAYVAESVDELTASLATKAVYVGQSKISAAGIEAIEKAVETFKAAPSFENYQSIQATANDDEYLTAIEFDPAKAYRIYNARAGESMSSINLSQAADGTVSGNIVTSDAAGPEDYAALWMFEGDEQNGYKLLNLNAGRYFVAGDNGTTTGTTNEASVLAIGAGAAADNWTLNVTNGSGLQNTYINAFHWEQNLNSHVIGTWQNGASDAGNLWMLEPVNEVALTLGESGRTMMTLPVTVGLPEGLTAYTSTGESGDKVVVRPVEGGPLPANTPVMITGEAGTYTLAIQNGDAESLYSCFIGTTLQTTVGSNVNAYTLAQEAGDAETSFALLPASGRTLPANTAYFVSGDSTPETLGTRLYDETTDGICQPEIETGTDTEYYDLSGRRVLNPTKGIYVTGEGRKVLVK